MLNQKYRDRGLVVLGLNNEKDHKAPIAFAGKTLVAAGQATKVDAHASPQAAGLLGCGVMAGSQRWESWISRGALSCT